MVLNLGLGLTIAYPRSGRGRMDSLFGVYAFRWVESIVKLTLQIGAIYGLKATIKYQLTLVVPATDYITPRESQTRKKHSKTFNVFSPKTEIFRNSFFPKTVKDWNNSCELLVESKTLEQFKHNLHQ